MGKWDQNNNKIHQQRTVIIIKNNDYKTKINKQNFNTKFIFLKQKQKNLSTQFIFELNSVVCFNIYFTIIKFKVFF